MDETITYVGLDVHKERISVALAQGGREGEVHYRGEIANRPAAVAGLAATLAATGGRLVFCYEAGPCGYGLYRKLAALGHHCTVVAPSLIPRRPGDRVKTNRRDCRTLARLERAGELTAVWVPEPAHEAMRDLVRARLAAVEGVRRARQQMQGFLLRHERIYTGRSAWTKAHRYWLAGLVFEHPAQQIVLQDLIDAVDQAVARRIRLEAEIRRLLPHWSMAPTVAAYQAMRGVALIAAVTLAAELGDLHRFANPRQLMAYLGLTPSEHSSGKKRRQGAITKAGNGRARRMLVEGAWTYRLPARIGQKKLAGLDGLPKPVREIAWKAQVRLCARYRELLNKGRPVGIVTVAIAREMAAFLWAIARHAAPRSVA